MRKLSTIGFLSAAVAMSYFCATVAHSNVSGQTVQIAQMR